MNTENVTPFQGIYVLKIIIEIDVQAIEEDINKYIGTAVQELVKRLESKKLLKSNRWSLDNILAKKHMLLIEGEVKTTQEEDMNNIIGTAVQELVSKLERDATVRHQWNLFKATESQY